MRAIFSALALLLIAASSSHAQFIYRGYQVAPSPFPGNYNLSRSFVSPYGYRSTVNTGVYPTPFGYNSYYTYDTRVRPFYMGPYHSVIFDPFTRTYRYTTGTTSTPNYSYQYVNPVPYVNPYVSPYPYAAYPY